MSKRLTPQEKKALSLKRDRRENYGQNDKASRKLVPLRKAQANRRVRRADKAALAGMEDADAVAPARPKPDWVKSPGRSLSDRLADQRASAARREGRKGRTEAEWIAWYRRFYGEKVAQRMAAYFEERRR